MYVQSVGGIAFLLIIYGTSNFYCYTVWQYKILGFCGCDFVVNGAFLSSLVCVLVNYLINLSLM